jgi:hypothetical protein
MQDRGRIHEWFQRQRVGLKMHLTVKQTRMGRLGTDDLIGSIQPILDAMVKLEYLFDADPETLAAPEVYQAEDYVKWETEITLLPFHDWKNGMGL